jgi:flavin-binding protein dodecin
LLISLQESGAEDAVADAVEPDVDAMNDVENVEVADTAGDVMASEVESRDDDIVLSAEGVTYVT